MVIFQKRFTSHFLLLGAFVLSFAIRTQASSVSSQNAEDTFQNNLDLLNKQVRSSWEFYWRAFLTPGDSIDSVPLLVDVPSQWNNYVVNNNEKLSGNGYASYRKTIYLDQSLQQVGLKIPDFYTSYRLFVNGKLVAKNGNPGTIKETTEPDYLPMIVQVDLKAGHNELVIHVANFHHFRGGFYDHLTFGDYYTLVTGQHNNDLIGLFVLGCILMVAIFMLSMFFYWRHDNAILYFALFSLMLGLRIATYELELFSRFVPSFPWWLNNKLEYISLYLSWAFLCMLATHIFSYLTLIRFIKYFAWFCYVFVVITVVFSLVVYSRALYLNIAVGACMLILTFCFFVYNIFNSNVDSRLNLVSISLVCIANIMILLGFLRVIPLNPIITLAIYLAGFIIFATEMSRRFAKSFGQVEKLKDETEHQKAQIEEKNKELFELERLKTRWFNNVAHELRTPLTLIKGPLANVIKETHINSGIAADLQLMQRNVGQLSGIISEILDISKIEEGKLKLNLTTFDLAVLVRSSALAFDSNARYKGVQLKVNTPQSYSIEADQEKLRKAVTNLVSNALKFTHRDGTITVTLTLKNSGICIRVSDTGEGINTEDQKHVFDRFYQSNDKSKERRGGTGIGLSLVKEIVVLHGGEVYLNSEYGFGSSFTICLPESLIRSRISETEETEVELSPDPSDQYTLRSDTQSRILLVDDNDDMRDYLRSILCSEFKLYEAADGIEALEYLNDIQTDLIISDVMMPRMDGIELAKKVKANLKWSEIPFITLTALDSDDDRLHTLRIGIDDYITKPFNGEELKVRVTNLLKNRSARQQTEVKDDLSFDDELLVKLENEVKENLTEDFLTVSYLADKVAMSERNLQRYLKKVSGLSPAEFILEIKLQTALRLLEKKKYPTIKEVALHSGFDRSARFSASFEKRFGRKPLDYFI